MCFRYRKLLIPYYEGDLGASVVKKVERHLAKCPRCRTELDAIRLVAGALTGSDVPPAEPANDLWARVSARIADESPQPVRRDWFRAVRGLTAGAAAAAIVGVIAIRLLTPAATQVATTHLRDNSPKRQAAVPIDNKADKQPAAKVRPTDTTKPAHLAPTPQAPGKTDAPSPKYTPRVRRWFAHNPSAPAKAKAKRPVEVAIVYGLNAEQDKRVQPVHDLCLSSDGDSATTADATASVRSTPKRNGGSAKLAYSRCFDAGSRSATSAHDETVATAAPGTVGVQTPAAVMCAKIDATAVAPASSVVDDLNETEGVRTAAIFSYP